MHFTRKMRSFLLPISVDSTAFSSIDYAAAIDALPVTPNRALFLVADRLQIYNKAADSTDRIGSLIARFAASQRYLIERRKWLARIRGRSTFLSTCQEVRVEGIAEFADAECFKVLRNVRILFELDQSFHHAVSETAELFASRTQGTKSEFGRRHALSIAHTLEEIALNIRIRVHEGVSDEFYPGDYPLPLLKLYQGAYDASVFELAEITPKGVPFAFYSLGRGNGAPTWVRVSR
jgi:hypothetical protein